MGQITREQVEALQARYEREQRPGPLEFRPMPELTRSLMLLLSTLRVFVGVLDPG
jgi:hypothetical protein